MRCWYRGCTDRLDLQEWLEGRRHRRPTIVERGIEIETVSAELVAATARLNDLQLAERPLRITKKIVDETVAQFEGILERAPLDTRVATVRDLFERVDVDNESSRPWRSGT
jgi:hypothetical protein